MVPPLPTCRSSVKRISVNFAFLCLSDIIIKILKESQFTVTVESGSPGEHLILVILVKPVHSYLNYCHAKILQKTIQNSFLKFLLHTQNTCLCNRENILFVFKIVLQRCGGVTRVWRTVRQSVPVCALRHRDRRAQGQSSKNVE